MSAHGPLPGGAGWSMGGCAPGAPDAAVRTAWETTVVLGIRAAVVVQGVRVELDLDTGAGIATCVVERLGTDTVVAVAEGSEPTSVVWDTMTACGDDLGLQPGGD